MAYSAKDLLGYGLRQKLREGYTRADLGRDVVCLTELGDVKIDGDLQISGKCTLSGTEVLGDVTLFAGGLPLPMKIAGGSGGPLRAVALVPRGR